MKVKIDFMLNRRFGVVECIIFRLVLNGFTDVHEIVEALPLFSDSVIANAIKTMVNCQIISVNTEVGRLSLSEPIVAIIEMCYEKVYELSVPCELMDDLLGSGILISNNSNEAIKELKKAILYELLPGIRLDMYMDSLDFVICGKKRGGQIE